MTILVTGAAGFIGFHLSMALLEKGFDVVGVDNLNDYYDVKLKNSRLKILKNNEKFHFFNIDISKIDTLQQALSIYSFDYILHLAAQAGVRYSLQNPYAYADSNLTGFVNILEIARAQEELRHFLFASSSSVYGQSSIVPFSENQKLDEPVSLYAATKKSNELLAYSYSHLYGIKTTGLRFFTVYGPWGRPDMAYFSFTDKILNGEKIDIYNNGELKRDFTYIDDVIKAILLLLNLPPNSMNTPFEVLNIGNNKPVKLLAFVETIESLLDRKANKDFLPMQPGDVYETYADITKINKLTGFEPKTSIEQGLTQFIKWYREFYEI